MAPIAGWYDDPRDAARLRYWDGDAWTEHVTPKVAARGTASGPVASPIESQAGSAGQPPWQYPGGTQAQQQTWQYGQPTQRAWQPGPAPAVTRYRTPDGVQVTTWIKRFAAWLLDVIFVFFGSLPLTAYFLYRYLQAMSDQAGQPGASAFLPSGAAITWETAFAVVFIAAEVCYQTFCLRRWGATPGKQVLGISVRCWDQGGRLPWPVVARRVGFIYGLAAIGLVPVIGVVASLVGLLDYLWPLWDRRRQALHDKFAGTAVIEGPRREPTA